METLRVLVTGGAGFIGSHLTKALLVLGYDVIVLDNLSRSSLESLSEVVDSIEFIHGDVRDSSLVESVTSRVDVVFHLAALTDVVESMADPELYFDVNVKGTLNIARFSRRASSLIFASTAAVYGEPERLPIAEDHPLNPKSPYAASKVAGEALVLAYSNIHGYRPVIARIFNVYGPRQSRSYAGVIVEFLKRVSEGKPPVIYGDGLQVRDFIYVDDVVEALVNMLRYERARGVYNIGSGVGVRILDLANTILRLAGRSDLKPLHVEPRPGDIRYSIADITKARRELNFNPKVTLEDGLRRLIKITMEG